MAQQTVLEIPLDDDLFKVLASESRREILRALQQRRMTGTELATRLSLGKPAVSEHLKKLHEAGLVDRHDDAERRWVYFSLTQKGRDILEPKRTRFILMLALGITAMLVGLAAGMALYGALDGEGLRPDQVSELESGSPGDNLAGHGLTGDYVVLPKANVDLANGTFTGPFSVVHDPDPARTPATPTATDPADASGTPAQTQDPNATDGTGNATPAEADTTAEAPEAPLENSSVNAAGIPGAGDARSTVSDVTTTNLTPVVETDVATAANVSAPPASGATTTNVSIPAPSGNVTTTVTQTVTVCTTRPILTTTTITTTGTTTIPVVDPLVDPLTGLVGDTTTTTQTVGVQEVVRTSNRTTCTTTTSTAPSATAAPTTGNATEMAGNTTLTNTTAAAPDASVPAENQTVHTLEGNVTSDPVVTVVDQTVTSTADATTTTSPAAPTNASTDAADGNVTDAVATTDAPVPDAGEEEPAPAAPTVSNDTATQTPTETPILDPVPQPDEDLAGDGASQDVAGGPTAGELQDGDEPVTAPQVGADVQPLLLVAFGLVLLAFASRRWT